MTTDEPAPATSAHSRPAAPEGLATPAYAEPVHVDSEHESDGEGEQDADREQDADGEAEDDDPEPEHDDQGKGKDVQQSEQPDDQQPQPQAPAMAAAAAAAGDWQAVYSPAHGAYYFYNTVTQQTTWTNPLQPAASSSAPEASSSAAASGSTTPAPAAASLYALQEAAAAQGIDPSLAYLDPSLAGPSGPGADTFTAKFSARTGAFTRPDGRDPTHLSEYERAKRMSMAYFDVGQWEQDLDAQHEQEQEAGKKRKRPTKKDLERYKEQKRLKKIAKTAWLRT